MPSFGEQSMSRLVTCDMKIQVVAFEVVKYWDCHCPPDGGMRTLERQAGIHAAGNSGLTGGADDLSNHNYDPSQAMDLVPWVGGIGVPWPGNAPDDETRIRWSGMFYALGGYVLATCRRIHGWEFRSGMDWDGDRLFTDQKFHDLGHHEIPPQYRRSGLRVAT